MIKRIWMWFVRRINAKHEKEWEEAVRELHRKKVNRRFLVDG